MDIVTTIVITLETTAVLLVIIHRVLVRQSRKNYHLWIYLELIGKAQTVEEIDLLCVISKKINTNVCSIFNFLNILIYTLFIINNFYFVLFSAFQLFEPYAFIYIVF